METDTLRVRAYELGALGLLTMALSRIWGFPKIRGTILGVHNKDYSILGSILGSPYFGKLPYVIGHQMIHEVT